MLVVLITQLYELDEPNFDETELHLVSEVLLQLIDDADDANDEVTVMQMVEPLEADVLDDAKIQQGHTNDDDEDEELLVKDMQYVKQ